MSRVTQHSDPKTRQNATSATTSIKPTGAAGIRKSMGSGVSWSRTLTVHCHNRRHPQKPITSVPKIRKSSPVVDCRSYVMIVGTFELAIILGVTDRWIRQLVIDGVLQHVDDSGKALFDAEQCAEAFKRFIEVPVDRRAEGIDERLANAKRDREQDANRLANELQKIWVRPTTEEKERE